MADIINTGVPTPIQIYGRAPNGQLQAVTTDGSGNISIVGSSSGTVSSGTAGQVGYYATSSSTMSGNPNLNVANGTLTLGVTSSVLGAVASAEGTAPSGVANQDLQFGDSVTHTWSHNSNNNGTSSFSGSWQNTNVTPVTVSAIVATDQNLMSATIPGGTLNRVGRTLRVWLAGVYSTAANNTSAITVKIKLGAVTLLSVTTAALSSVTPLNDQFNLSALLSVQTGGASGVFEGHGNLAIGLGTGNLVADTVYTDTNTAVSSAIDLTASQTLQVTIAFSSAAGTNTATQRQMVSETIG